MLWFLLVGLVAGWLAGKLTRGSGFGVLGDIVIGVLGAFIGGHLFRLVGFAVGGTIGSVVVATVGAIVLVLVVRAIKSASARPSSSWRGATWAADWRRARAF